MASLQPSILPVRPGNTPAMHSATLPAPPTTSCPSTLRSNIQLSRLIRETVHYTSLALYYNTSTTLVPTTLWNVQCKAAITLHPHHPNNAYLCVLSWSVSGSHCTRDTMRLTVLRVLFRMDVAVGRSAVRKSTPSTCSNLSPTLRAEEAAPPPTTLVT
ncbi:hypothetical protein E2C01_013170 [Portunus trituberculatus]|uniref:Uncharacterized protein n=1 Tax=Portunus trituberculatus TaxID=210409 RepID=A0A5B7DGM1_PORTR|nr:hypothetical protein [Portunus trituberculatus]